MELESYIDVNKNNPDFIITDIVENAIDSLETALLFFERNNNLKWKWISGALLHSLYMFCIANLTGGNYDNVLTGKDIISEDIDHKMKRGDEGWKKSVIIPRKKSPGYTIKWIDLDNSEIPKLESSFSRISNPFDTGNKKLISFWSALARVQDDYGHMMTYMGSEPLRLKPKEWKSIEIIYEHVDKFINFIPTTWAISIELIKKCCLDIIGVIKYLSLDSFNIIYIDDNMESRIKNVTNKLINNLKKPNVEILKGIKSKTKEEIENEMKLKEYIAIIKKGETDQVEFKETLRVDIKDDTINKDLEFEVVKTISAFLNTNGGKLFVGVSDDGKIMGLKRDFNTFSKDKGKDQFQLYVVSKVNNLLGKEFNNFIKYEFDELNGNIVFIINIIKSNLPVFINNKGKKEFYIRIGNTSQKLDIEEAFKHFFIILEKK